MPHICYAVDGDQFEPSIRVIMETTQDPCRDETMGFEVGMWQTIAVWWNKTAA